MARTDVVIAGYAETKVVYQSGRSAYDFAGLALSDLLEKSGIGKDEIDGLSVTLALSEGTNPFFAVYMADALGLTPTWLNAGGIGGCSAAGGVARAMWAIREGACRIAVVLSADAPSTAFRANYGAYRPEFQDPQGVQGPPATFGLLMSRYDHQYGLDPRALGKIAITQREHALRNPNALDKFRKPLTMDDYLASRSIADPLRVLDCVMYCDGANAFLVMSEEEARARGIEKVAYPTAYAEVTNHNGADPLADITESGFYRIAPKVFAKAGLTPAGIGMFQPYDDFTIAVLMQLEAFGFCGTGEGSAFVRDTDLSFSGTLPLNTGGGQISAGQPGLASGGLNLAEAVRQLFGEGGDRQVPGVRNALVTGIGVIPYGRNWGCSAAMILEV
ncbi:thiolase family protein [Xanthobacter autotrophicus DSM 597]|uniref:thiolase family protein n=1 Tax=Xanthobacter wiegelii TaxID=3119913 RepID=UPI00372696A0